MPGGKERAVVEGRTTEHIRPLLLFRATAGALSLRSRHRYWGQGGAIYGELPTYPLLNRKRLEHHPDERPLAEGTYSASAPDYREGERTGGMGGGDPLCIDHLRRTVGRAKTKTKT